MVSVGWHEAAFAPEFLPTNLSATSPLVLNLGGSAARAKVAIRALDDVTKQAALPRHSDGISVFSAGNVWQTE